MRTMLVENTGNAANTKKRYVSQASPGLNIGVDAGNFLWHASLLQGNYIKFYDLIPITRKLVVSPLPRIIRTAVEIHKGCTEAIAPCE
jgi:hypothetical protein